MEPRKGKQAPPIHTYLDTIYWSFYFDVEAPNFIRSEFFKQRNFDDISFCFQAVTSSDTSITIELLRMPMIPDDGYVLEVYFTLLGSKAPTECKLMNSDYVSVDYKIADLKENDTQGSWVLRCVIKMKETTYLENNLRNQHENLLRHMVNNNPRYGKVSRDKIDAMASLLKCKSLSKIFTGRQNDSFAINKCIFIERTLRYAEEISKKFVAKKRNVSYNQRQLPLNYLFYIYCEKDGKISPREAAELYVSAHYYGLEYLQVECAEFLLKDLEFLHELFIEVLLVADFVNNQDLLDKVLGIYVKNTAPILDTTQFKIAMNSEELYSHSMVHVLYIKTTEVQQLGTGSSTGEASEQPDSIALHKSSGRTDRKKRHGKGRK